MIFIKNPPGHWEEFKPYMPFASRGWQHRIVGLTVLRSISTTSDGKKWLHVSVSRRSKLPDYDDLQKVKRDFIGEEVEAYQVMAAAKDHVNVHKYCLHIWAPMDGQRCVANLQDLILEEKA